MLLIGKRALSQMSAFDFVILVALGSTLATIPLNADVSRAEGAAASATLAGLQVVISFAFSRSMRAEAIVRSSPYLLLRHGRIDEDARCRERGYPATRSWRLCAAQG